jgi:general secretion pathway protein D
MGNQATRIGARGADECARATPSRWRKLVPFFLLSVFPALLAACNTIPEPQIGSEPVVYGSPRHETGKERRDYPGRPLASPLAAGGAEPSAFEFGTGSFTAQPGEGGAAARGGGNGGNGGPITLNLVRVSVDQAAKSVLGDVFGVSYTIDPRAEGTVTIQTPRPVDRAGLAALFEASLKSAGLALVDTGQTYRIVPADAAAAAGPAFRGESGGELGSSVQIISLRHVAASEMRRILEPMAAAGSILRADDARGTLTVSGSPADIAALRDTASVFDVDTMRGMSFALVPVKSVSPDVIADDLKRAFGSDREGPMSGMVQIIPNKKLKSVLIISPNRTYLTRAERWVRRMDAQARGSERQFYTYTARNRPAKELTTILQTMFAPAAQQRQGDSVAPRFQPAPVDSPGRNGGDAFAGPALASSGGSGRSGGFGGGFGGRDPEATVPFEEQGGNGGGRAGQGQDGEQMKIVADEPNNAILVLATPTEFQRVQRVLENLDIMANQVLIEATIAEVALRDDLQFGLRWYFQNQRNTAQFTDAISGALGAVFPGFSYALRATNVQVTLNALNDITKVNVVSSPSLMVVDNRVATLQIGDQVPITTQSAVSVLTPGAPVVNSIQYRDTGVILQIRPKINESGRVLLEIEQEVSSVQRTTSSNLDSPTIQQRRVKTTVVVNDGESIALGGLIQDAKTQANKQVPVLGDLPLIGGAFRSRDDGVSKTELVIFITPRVVRDLNEAQAVTEEYRQRLSNFGVRPKKNLPKTLNRILE